MGMVARRATLLRDAVSALRYSTKSPPRSHTFNVCTGFAISINRLARDIGAVLDRPVVNPSDTIRVLAIFVIRSGILARRHANLSSAPSIGRWSAAAGRLRLLRAAPIDKPFAGLDPNLGCARSSSAALSLALSPALPQILALPYASQVQPNGIGGPNQNPEQSSKPSAPG
jgi:hypothetical protein